ncbi:GNAT family N-acetyltransferase [Quadrisphaera sp. DSM 44207]|uniref:GNAT family N-acetyltransferase n=1 Tax=Quadrisphaera sp. DSM 44207 TaxID=1881057 RepID=UPI000887823B|nr:GNAT family N-acetyltransferase [Quadrisphaera sp. DSM 44207]SDQ06236.1 [SSU ribosomal protein S5P]-alanine acetyltransferase [Quadrisphaera sp. DSM 44207]
MDVGVRLVTEDDAPALADLLRASREHLAPWEPERDEAHSTEAEQRRLVAAALAQHREGRTVPLVIVEDGDVVGRVTVADVVRGAFQSAHLGYWVAQARTGRGVATAAVARAVRVAFDDLGLHRLQADTLVHNTASQRVLARNGFTRIGMAPRYLRIAGRWQDCLLHQLLHEPRS